MAPEKTLKQKVNASPPYATQMCVLAREMLAFSLCNSLMNACFSSMAAGATAITATTG